MHTRTVPLVSIPLPFAPKETVSVSEPKVLAHDHGRDHDYIATATATVTSSAAVAVRTRPDHARPLPIHILKTPGNGTGLVPMATVTTRLTYRLSKSNSTWKKGEEKEQK